MNAALQGEEFIGNYTLIHRQWRLPICHLDRSVAEWRDLRFPTSGAKERARYGAPGIRGYAHKPQISPLRFAPVEMTNLLRILMRHYKGQVECCVAGRRVHRELHFDSPAMATSYLSSRPERSVVERSAVSRIWRKRTARYGAPGIRGYAHKPQISPLRFAPVEMTNII